MLLARSQCLIGSPVRSPRHCCCLHRHTLPCATFSLLTHCWCVQFFDIGCWQITGLP
ncbi:unnamed protein product [Staurois parvus]|uniref:Uncharacterized protein n=1 Tax=Staurois parvus TaxID=386267 RepID=A0ABN9BWA9_9NEOB|nr:unnamed protein product [Staurois parvus]